MSNKQHTLSSQEVDIAEHDTAYRVKNVAIFGNTGSSMVQLKVDSSGNLLSGLNIPTYDNITLSYTGSNLTGVVYKVGVTTVATLTLDYDGSDNLITVTKS